MSWKWSWNCCLWLVGLYIINVQTILVILSKCFRIRQLLMNWVMFQSLTSSWWSSNSPICNYRLKLWFFFFWNMHMQRWSGMKFFCVKRLVMGLNICLLCSLICVHAKFWFSFVFSLFVCYILFFSLWSILSFDFCIPSICVFLYVFPFVVLGAS